MPIDRPLPAAVSVAAATLLVLSLATGCSAQPVPAETSASTGPSMTATPTPTADPTHTIAFGGDCANVFGVDGQAELLGGRLEAVPTSDWIRPAIGTLGGIECAWAIDGVDATMEPFLAGVQVLPLEAVSADFQAEVGGVRCEPAYDAVECRMGRASGTSWLIARADYSGVPAAPQPDQALFDEILERVAARVSDFAAPSAAARTSSWWSLEASCEQLGTELEMKSLYGENYRTGWWEGDPTLLWDYRVAASQDAAQFCQWFPDFENPGEGGSVHDLTTLKVWPGAAWDEELFASGEPLSVEGAARAVIREHDVLASDGVNVVSISRVREPALAAQLLARFLQAQKG